MLHLLWFTWHHRIFRSSFPRHWAMPKYVFPGQISKNGYGERRSGRTHLKKSGFLETERPNTSNNHLTLPRCWKWVFPDRLGERFWTCLLSSKPLWQMWFLVETVNTWGFRRKASSDAEPPGTWSPGPHPAVETSDSFAHFAFVS